MDKSTAVETPNHTGAGLSLMAHREKYWSELTSDERIERLRQHVKHQSSFLNRVESTVYRLRRLFTKHNHVDGNVVSPVNEHDDLDVGTRNSGRVWDKEGDDVYL